MGCVRRLARAYLSCGFALSILTCLELAVSRSLWRNLTVSRTVIVVMQERSVVMQFRVRLAGTREDPRPVGAWA